MKKLLVLVLVVAGMAMGVAGCQKAQTPEQTAPSEIKSSATPTPKMNTGTTTTPASVVVPTTTPSAKTTTGTMTR